MRVIWSNQQSRAVPARTRVLDRGNTRQHAPALLVTLLLPQHDHAAEFHRRLLQVSLAMIPIQSREL